MFVRLGLFLSSFSPLFAILALRFRNDVLAGGCLVLACAGFLAAFWVIRSESSKGAASFEIRKVEDQGPEVAGYLASYLLPFVAIDEPSLRLAIGYLVFLLVAALVYVQSDMIQINPIFYVFGRRVQKITTERSDWEAFLITKRRVLAGESILATTLANGVLVRSTDRES